VVEIAIPGSDSALVEQFRQSYGVTYPILMDDGQVTAAYGILETPTIIIVGRDGFIAYEGGGFHSEAELRDILSFLL